jgi:hypothetical protein
MLSIAICGPALAQDTTYIYAHFLYGSKPRAKCPGESRWFGGIHGGHAGVGFPDGQILNFLPSGCFHKKARKDTAAFCSRYALHNESLFYGMFGTPGEDVRMMKIRIPVSSAQMASMDSLRKAYITTSPYDYAFLGMRCGSATYDILAHGHVLKPLNFGPMWRRIFYPKRVRKRLILLAKRNNWQVIYQQGSDCRKWESD